MAEKKHDPKEVITDAKKNAAVRSILTELAGIPGGVNAYEDYESSGAAMGEAAFTGVSTGLGTAGAVSAIAGPGSALLGPAGIVIGAAAFGFSLYAANKKKKEIRKQKERLARQWREGLRQYKERIKAAKGQTDKSVKETQRMESQLVFSISKEAQRDADAYSEMSSGLVNITAERQYSASKEKEQARILESEDNYLQRLEILSQIKTELGKEEEAKRDVFSSYRTRSADVIDEKLEELGRLENA